MSPFNQNEIEDFEKFGYVFPVEVLSDSELKTCREKLESFEATQDGKLEASQRNKSHLLFKWLDDLIRDPRILDPVEDLIGSDILCWNTIFWIKEAHSQSFVSWHQDTRYWGLSSENVLTAWLALSPASQKSGCMRVMPGTHRGEVLPHDDRYHHDNMLTRGQEISEGVDESESVLMPLEAGQMSIHNYRIAHTSGPNDSDDRRIGISMHYMPPDTKQIVGNWDSAALVRGQDDFKHFEPTPVPRNDFDPDAVQFHEKATQALRSVLYAGAEKNTRKL
jgi:ribosomal protein L35